MALRALHDSNIMHRDVKLDNLMLDRHGYLKVIDFGLARILRQNEKAFTVCGTPAYMAPEIHLGQPYSYAAEWWTVGTLIYQMIFGVAPFSNRNVVAQKNMIIEGELEFPSTSQFQYSAELQDIVTKMLQKSPEDRLGSVAGASEILAHPWFTDLDLDMILHK